MGIGSADIHLQDPPDGSLLLLGHINLSVRNLDDAKIYFITGLDCGESTMEKAGEVWANIGPSQIRLSQGQQDTKFPGEIKIWIEDIRTTADQFNMLGRTLGTDLVAEMREAVTGGEFSTLLHDPVHVNKYHCFEAPWGWAEKLRAIPADTSKHQLQYPPKTKNTLAIVDAYVKLKDRGSIAGAARFYEHFLNAKLTKKYSVYDRQAQMDKFHVHFAPGTGFHQTMTFQAMKGTDIPNNLASVCIYIRDKANFRLTFAKCKNNGLLDVVSNDKSWKEVEDECEFVLKGVVDPDNNAMVLAMRHYVRFLEHPECPLCAASTSMSATNII